MASEYYRTFIGLPVQVDNNFMGALKILTRALEEERITWVQARNFHLTLRFLGKTSISDVNDIHSALDGVDLPSEIPAEISGPGSFGPQSKPRVIWTGFRNEEPFIRLKNEVKRILGLLNYPAFEGIFTPHLTLGRIRGLKDVAGYYRILESVKDQFTGIVNISELVFYRSTLGTGGPEYSRLGVWKLDP